MPRPEDLEDRKHYPAGDLPPEPEEENPEGEGHAGGPEDNSQADAADAKAGEEGAPNWEERYRQLEKKLGEQGDELGLMRQQNQELQTALQQMQQSQTPEGQEESKGLQDQLQSIRQKMDDGDLSPDEAMFETANIVAQMSKMEAEQITEQRLQKYQQDTQAEQVLNQFHRDNPDFEELRQTGTLEEVKKQLPGLHDDFSAYYAYKAQTAADEAYKRGKEEMEKLASGDAAAGKVLSKPGQTIRQKNQKPLTSPKDVQQSMMDRLKAARAGG